MCTLSWVSGSTASGSSASGPNVPSRCDQGGDAGNWYEVHFNRDERRTRLPAQPPRVIQQSGVRIAAPRDGDAGGSWIAVNQYGVTLCLLNRHHEALADPQREFTSRGLLLLAMAGVADTDQVHAHLRQTPLENYQPFDLAIFALGEAPRAFCWNTQTLELRELGEKELPVCSSSRDYPGVRRVRHELIGQALSRGSLDGESLRQIHADHEPEKGVYSFCMHREDAQTVSYSRVSVDRNRARFAYADGPPCSSALALEVVMEISSRGRSQRTSPPGH